MDPSREERLLREAVEKLGGTSARISAVVLEELKRSLEERPELADGLGVRNDILGIAKKALLEANPDAEAGLGKAAADLLLFLLNGAESSPEASATGLDILRSLLGHLCEEGDDLRLVSALAAALPRRASSASGPPLDSKRPAQPDVLTGDATWTPAVAISDAVEGEEETEEEVEEETEDEVENKARFVCLACKRDCRTSNRLRTHMQVHTKPHRCPHCLKVFSWPYKLRIHKDKKHPI